jgi:hypothetical protein
MPKKRETYKKYLYDPNVKKNSNNSILSSEKVKTNTTGCL